MAPPASAEAAWPISVAGGQSATSATPASPRATAACMAAISPRAALTPFIFQFPATSGRTSGVIAASIVARRYHAPTAYAKPTSPVREARGKRDVQMLDGMRKATQGPIGKVVMAVLMG